MASNRRRVLHSTPSRAGGACTGVETMFQTLESRQLLSVESSVMGPLALPANESVVEWNGHHIRAISNSYVVTFSEALGSDAADLVSRRLAAAANAAVTGVRTFGNGRYAQLDATGLSLSQVGEAINSVNANLGFGRVMSVEPNATFDVTRVPNDPDYTKQWHLENTGQAAGGSGLGVFDADIDASTAWDSTIGTRDTVVGVIDTGVFLTHPDLVNNIYTNPNEIAGNGIDDDANGYVDDIHGFDFGNLDNNPNPDAGYGVAGHGTAVAGVIGAQGNNGVGIVGVAWNVSILPLKIANNQGQLTLAAITAAHDYATMMRGRNVNIVATNNSYGLIADEFYGEDGDTGFNAEASAISRYIDSGGIFVAAAGNSALDNDSTLRSFPASYNLPGILSVAATNNDDDLAGFSNYGVTQVDLAAPGVQVYTTEVIATGNGFAAGYGYVDGTSFSSPLVAGMVAVLKALKPTASAVEIKQVLIDSSDPIASLQGRVVSGGRVNLARAIQLLSISGPVLRSINPGPVTTQIDLSTGSPLSTITAVFNKAINNSLLTPSSATVLGAGADNAFGTIDDITLPVTAVNVSLADSATVIVALDLTGFAGGRIPLGNYRVTFVAAQIKDTDGNFLNGTNLVGANQVNNFQIVATSGSYEANDTLATATALTFNASGQVNIAGATIGDGPFGTPSGLDVDIYQVSLPRGGQITAEIRAKRLSSSSNLDSYLRIFSATGVEIVGNDNYYGSDSYLDVFVLTGGLYYVAVSGYGNPTYNPTVGGSGTSQSLGVYDLIITSTLVTPGTGSANSTFVTPKRIPPSGTLGTTSDSIIISDPRQLLDLNVRVNLSHTFDSDLQISIIGPNNLEIMLFNRRGGSGDNLTATLFDDEATTAITSGFAPFSGNYRPEQALSFFDGLSAAGMWTLKIVDTLSLNIGTLNSWSIDYTVESSLAGPFEANDTIPTAKPLQAINGTGTANITAFIGDGGFGIRDRDIFTLVVDAGSTLNAVLTSTSALDGALRLFNAQGVEILTSSLANEQGATIDSFIFRDAGTYYIAISDSVNIGYNPFIVTTGSNSATVGGYTMTVAVSRGVSDPSLALNGNFERLGFNTSGIFNGPAGSTNPVGVSLNGLDFLMDRTGANQTTAPNQFFGFTATGDYFRNSAGGQARTDLPFTLTDQSDTYNRRVVSKANFRGIDVERTVSFGVDDHFLAVDVYLVNNTNAALSNAAWMEAFDPNQGLNLDLGTATTLNDVSASQKFVSAKVVNNTFQQGLTFALAAADIDTRARATTISSLTANGIRDARQLMALPVADPNGAAADSFLALTYDLGTIASGAKASFRYFIFMGETPAAVDQMYFDLNNGLGAGHLTVDSATPATEVLSSGATAPELPYRTFYPEGFSNEFIYTYVPVFNPNDQPTRVFLVARNEATTLPERDLVLGDITVAANSRSGFTLNTRELFLAGQQLVRPNTPYALELRSERPVAATFSYYDTMLLQGFRSAVGEPFSSRVSDTWSFGQVTKAEGVFDFVLFYNTTDAQVKVTTTLLPEGGGTPIELIYDVEPFRRAGWSINNEPSIPMGRYGVLIEAQGPVVASVSHYDSVLSVAEGFSGSAGLGSTSGLLPEGRYGLDATGETIGIVNPGDLPSTVTFSFIAANGSTYRTSSTVPARGQTTLDVATLPDFLLNQPYSVLYTSTQPVAMDMLTLAFNQALATAPVDRAYSLWGFGEGFRAGDNLGHPGVKEYLRLFNPSAADVVIEITIGYDNGLGSETFRQTLISRQVVELDVHTLVTGSRRAVNAWYGLAVKAPTPIVAYFAHYDSAFPGAFGALGTPLGASAILT